MIAALGDQRRVEAEQAQAPEHRRGVRQTPQRRRRIDLTLEAAKRVAWGGEGVVLDDAARRRIADARRDFRPAGRGSAGAGEPYWQASQSGSRIEQTFGIIGSLAAAMLAGFGA